MTMKVVCAGYSVIDEIVGRSLHCDCEWNKPGPENVIRYGMCRPCYDQYSPMIRKRQASAYSLSEVGVFVLGEYAQKHI